jgi:tyrosine-specific transport protein
MKKAIDFLKPLAVFLGTVIGVGIFGLPFVSQKAGFVVVFVYFLFMVVVAVLIHFLFGEVALKTKKIYRLPGYVGEYLGQKWKKISFFVTAAGIFGALLAYLIIGGQFLNSFLNSFLGGGPVFYTFLFFISASYLVWRGIKSVSNTELLLLLVFLLIIGLFFVKLLPFIDLNNFKAVRPRYLAFPFGIVLFSLWGTAIVPEVKEMIAASASGQEETRLNLRRVLAGGLIFAAVVYLFFIFIILGASGSAVSREAISGTEKVLGYGSNIIKLGFLFGAVCCFTSFITLGLTLKKIFWYDFGLSKNFSWALTCFLPLILFLAGAREFIKVISFTGAVAVGSEGLIIIFLYKAFLKKKFKRKMNKVFYFLIPIFILGVAFEIISFF